MEQPLVRYSTQHGIALLEFDNPPANTYSYEMMTELDRAILCARFDAEVSVLVLRGVGDMFFSAGADVEMLNRVSPQFKYNYWMDLFKSWQKDIGLDVGELGDYQGEIKFGRLDQSEIEFGAYAGHKRWENLLEVPDQRIRDALLNLIRVQGDTEFASTDQQRALFDTAPSDFDRRSPARIICEETCYAWQMAYLLVRYFGTSGKLEAQKLLERRAFKKTRLLGAFNEAIRNWLDMYAFTEFLDRDGKYQLKMESFSAFAPFARSIGLMLKEEQFHLGTGHTGLKRLLRAPKIPVPLIQKYFNKWLPVAYDLLAPITPRRPTGRMSGGSKAVLMRTCRLSRRTWSDSTSVRAACSIRNVSVWLTTSTCWWTRISPSCIFLL